MFGIGGQEIVIIGLIVLVIFGPSSLPKMARDLGRFVTEARRSIDEFKDELTAAEDDDDEDDKKDRKSARRRGGSGKKDDQLTGKANGKADRAEQDEHDL